MATADKAKSLDGLMKHLRDDCGIQISGSDAKEKLRQYGYYHGYKGYRFYKQSTNRIPYTDFSEMVAVMEYDNELKSLVYPALMFIEMSVKNISLDVLVQGMRDTSIDNIYKSKMNDSLSNRNLRLKRLKVRDRLHSMLSNSYKHGNSMVGHFYNQGKEVPVWAIFEIMMLGDFADFLLCLNYDIREQITDELNMRVSYDTNCHLIADILFTVKELRNTVAHNNIAFDVRFKDRNTNKNVIKWVQQETGMGNISFGCFTDYIVLLLCVLKHVGYPKKDMKRLLREYEDCINNIYVKLPLPIYNKIVSTGIKGKLTNMWTYIGS